MNILLGFIIYLILFLIGFLILVIISIGIYFLLLKILPNPKVCIIGSPQEETDKILDLIQIEVNGVILERIKEGDEKHGNY